MRPLAGNPNRPSSYPINARVEPDTKDGLDRWTRATGASLSVIVRCLLKEGISSLDEARNGESPPEAFWNIAKHYDESRAFDGVQVKREAPRDNLIKLLIEELHREK